MTASGQHTAIRRIRSAILTDFAALWNALALEADRRELESHFVTTFPHNPILSPAGPEAGERTTEATFIWQASAGTSAPAQVQLHLNSITGDRGDVVDAGYLERVADSSLWAVSYLLPSELTASYRIAVTASAPGAHERDAASPDDAPDPRNPRRLVVPPGEHSALFVGPQAWEHPAWSSETPRRRRSTMHRVAVPAADGRTRDITLYRPSSAPVPRRLLVLFDGDSWLGLGIQSALDRREGEELAVALVSAVSPAHRARDLPYPARAAELVRDEVLPVVCAALHREFTAGSIIVSGQSYGGLASAGIVAEYPEVAGLAIAQSPSFHFIEGEDPRPPAGQRGDLSHRLRRSSSTASVIFTAGSHEGGLLDQAHIAVAAMSETAMRHEYREFTGGHDYAWWRHGLFWALDTLEP